MDQSNRPNGDLNLQVDFNMAEPLEFYYNVTRENVEGDNVDLGGIWTNMNLIQRWPSLSKANNWIQSSFVWRLWC